MKERAKECESFQGLLPPGVTKREAEVLRLIMDGRFDKEIASDLGISIRTVEKHVERLRAKFGVRSRKDLPHSRLQERENT